MRILRQSTTATVNIFLTSSSDHVTGLTGATLTVLLSKNGGAFNAISPTVNETSFGWYAISLTTSDTDTLGELIVHASATGSDSEDRIFLVETGVVDANIKYVNDIQIDGTGTTGDEWGPL